MKKFTKLIAAATAVILTLGFAGCTTGGSGKPTPPVNPVTYPGFINSQESGDNPQISEKYVVNVRSEGGMPLDGVKIAAKRDGQVIKRGISKSGKIEFAVSLGEYQLEIDEESLPAGYHLEEGVTYKTNATKREEITIKLSSRLLSASSSVTSYAPGNIMRDFSFTDCGDGNNAGPTYTLSKLLETKKAVVINFFYTTCGPCRAEFPYLQNAYDNWAANDIEVLAICTTSMGDNNQSVANFKAQNNLTIPMSIDRIGICQAFGVSAYPTTVVIDRYGMIAFRTSGGEPTTAFWTGLFNRFTSPDYKQYVDPVNPDDDPNTLPGDQREKPDVQMPSSAVLEQAALDEHVDAIFKPDDDDYSWPWLAGSDAEGSYIYSSNKAKGNSYSIVYAEIEMKEGEVLSFQYNVSSEANADYLYVFLDGDQMNTGYSGESNGWETVNLYVADRDKTVSLSFAFVKDPRDPDSGVGDDVAKIRNISLADATQGGVVKSLDVMRACASGEAENFEYEHYVDYELASDGFYHKVLYNEDGTKSDELGPIIYMTINQLSPWSDLHGKNLTAADGTTYASTIFSITAQKYVETKETDDGNTTFKVNIGGKDVTEAYTVYVLIMNYMPAPFYLIPVTEQLKEWADALVDDFEKGNAHENEWLEFCYYFDHYGAEHDDKTNGDGGTCKVDEDYTRGLTKYNAYEAYEKTDPDIVNSETYNADTQRNKAIIDFPLQLAHNGTYYHFKATRAGVYQIRSYTKGCSPSANATADNTDSYVTPDPKVLIYSKEGVFKSLTDGVLDHDAFKGVDYEGFNDYITLDQNEEIYFYLGTTSGTKTYYDFEITYLGESYQKMLVCSTGGGLWTYRDDVDPVVWIYIGIDVMYDDLTDCYYAVGADGKIDKSQPVYIDMLYSSFFMCNIKEYYMATLKFMIEDYAFEEHLHHGEDYQPVMEEALGKSTEGKQEGDKLYGLVPATREIVDILNMFINQNVDGGMGEGNGWLAFAVYDAKMGK